MRKTFCDACGKEVKEQGQIDKYDCCVSKYPHPNTYYDLCADCQKKIRLFIDEKVSLEGKK
jgi:hypothetical protein